MARKKQEKTATQTQETSVKKSDVVFKGILIGASIFFGLGFLSIGLTAGVFLVLGIDVAILIIRAVASGKSKELGDSIKALGEGMSEVGSAVAQTAVKTVVNIAKAGGTEIVEQGQGLWVDIGGKEGLKRGAKAIGRITEEAALFGITVVAESGKAVAHVTQETLENFNRKRNDKRLSETKRQALEDFYQNVEFQVIEDSNEME
jgi:hypothetical protein